MKIELTGQWAQARAFFAGIKAGAIKTAMGRELHAEANYLAGKMKEKLRTGPFQPLSPLTIAGRKLAGIGGTKPLNATLSLKNSITVSPTDPAALQKFIGVLRTAQRKNAKPGGKAPPLVNIAEIQEEGRTIIIRKTPKMMRFLFMLMKKAGVKPKAGAGGGKAYIVVRIPPRPFIRPVIEEHGAGAAERIMLGVAARVFKDIPGRAVFPPARD